MSFFQNVFAEDFRCALPLGDRQLAPDFVVPRNAGRGQEVVTAWKEGPYDLSGNDADGNSRSTLVIQYALNSRQNWAAMSVDVTASASSSAAVTAAEIVAALNANTIFSERFVASLGNFQKNTEPKDRVVITQRKPVTQFWFYIANGRAEEAIGFNARAGVAEAPTFFARHTIANRHTYTDGQNYLIELAPGTATQAALINSAVDANGRSKGYSSSDVQADYELLRGRSGLFTFKKYTVDGSDRITEIIEYPAGAVAGDFAKKTTYTYTGANNNPDQMTEEPYTLESGDIVTP